MFAGGRYALMSKMALKSSLRSIDGSLAMSETKSK